MSPFALNLEKTTIELSLVSLEPCINAFQSMVLLAKHEGDSMDHEWVTKTRLAMTPDELFRHKLVIIGLHYSALPRNSWNTFEAYLEDMEQTPPEDFRERLLDAYAHVYITDEAKREKDKPVDWKQALSSAKNYVTFLTRRFGEQLVDPEIETRAYKYIVDPEAMKRLITGHLEEFWNWRLKAEWERVRPILEESARAFNRADLESMSRNELVLYVTGKELEDLKWWDEVEQAERLVFVPNAHFGPHIQGYKTKYVYYIFFGARTPEDSDVHIPELDRAEIVSKLSALADKTRLRVLQMVSENGEMRSNEIMEIVKLSQPSISRYLSQLTASRFLQERRANGAKAYSLNKDRVERTLKSVSMFLLGRS